MAHKRKKGGAGKGNNTRGEGPPRIEMPDRRTLEKATWEMHKLSEKQQFSSIKDADRYFEKVISGGGPDFNPLTALDRAQSLVYEAFSFRKRKDRIAAAEEALEISPDCADAYVLLAEEARSVEEMKHLYEKGLEAGARAIGPDLFESWRGNFWLMISTRPYMRAREGLAYCLWSLGDMNSAMSHYKEMLELNPNDNQGMRYLLLEAYLEKGDHRATNKLIEQFKEDASLEWAYGRALRLYQAEGRTERASAALRDAFENGPEVPLFLLGLVEMPEWRGDYVTFNSPEESIAYVHSSHKAWKNTHGALEWMLETLVGWKPSGKAAGRLGPHTAKVRGSGV
jgi:tetratricopeptide (TPR) repeat protein